MKNYVEDKISKMTKPRLDSSAILEDISFFKKNASGIPQTEDLWYEESSCFDVKKLR